MKLHDLLFVEGSSGFGSIPRESYLPKDNPTLEQREGLPEGLEVWTYESPNSFGKPAYYGTAFVGKSQKPLWHYRFRDAKNRDEQITETIKIYQEKRARRAEQHAERSEFQHDYKVGDILVGSWGYDQTNQSWYEVVEVPSPKMVVLREISGKIVHSEQQSDRVVANPGHYIGPAIKKIPGPHGVRIESYLTVHKWDGKPKSQTAFGYGH